MEYKAKNVDTDKALEAISDSRKYQAQESAFRIEKERAFQEGVNKGLAIAEELFKCSNYEKKEEPGYADGVLEVIYELGKELDISTQDIRDKFSSVDEACAEFSDRVRKQLNGQN